MITIIITFILWLLFGGIGAHRFYLGQIKSGVAMFLLTILVLVFSHKLPFLKYVLIAWWVFDFFGLVLKAIFLYNHKDISDVRLVAQEKALSMMNLNFHDGDHEWCIKLYRKKMAVYLNKPKKYAPYVTAMTANMAYYATKSPANYEEEMQTIMTWFPKFLSDNKTNIPTVDLLGAYRNLSNYFCYNNDFTSAYDYSLARIQHLDETILDKERDTHYVNHCIVSRKAERLDDAITYGEKAIANVQQYELLDNYWDAYEALIDSYYQKNDEVNLRKHLEAYYQLCKENFSEDDSRLKDVQTSLTQLNAGTLSTSIPKESAPFQKADYNNPFEESVPTSTANAQAKYPIFMFLTQAKGMALDEIQATEFQLSLYSTVDEFNSKNEFKLDYPLSKFHRTSGFVFNLVSMADVKANHDIRYFLVISEEGQPFDTAKIFMLEVSDIDTDNHYLITLDFDTKGSFARSNLGEVHDKTVKTFIKSCMQAMKKNQ